MTVAAAVPVSNAKHVRFGQGRRRVRGRESEKGGKEAGSQADREPGRRIGGQAGGRGRCGVCAYGCVQVCMRVRASVVAGLGWAGRGGGGRGAHLINRAKRGSFAML